MTNPEETPFVDLPASLVEDVLGQAEGVGDLLLEDFRRIRASRPSYRGDLSAKGLLLNDSALGYPPLPTTCGVDGSYAVERLLGGDLAAAAAVAMEGLTPPSEKRYWEQPHHSTFMVAEAHHSETATVLRAVMLGRELQLAVDAPHELVLIDMTLTLPIIYFNQALNLAPRVPELQSANEFLKHCDEYLAAYKLLLQSQRSDRNHVGLPKYSTRREIGRRMGWPTAHDDRGLLSLILESGELTNPVKIEQPQQEWHFNTSALDKPLRAKIDHLSSEIIDLLHEVGVVYYKPHDWLPAIRLEMGPSIAANNHRLASVVQGLKHQCAVAGMMEPYPLYLADRTVKALAKAVPAFRQVTTQRISELYEGEVAEIFFAMHGYRTETGR